MQKAIGEGKFSTVYKATNPEGVTIALKKIKVWLPNLNVLDIRHDGPKVEGEVYEGSEIDAATGSPPHNQVLGFIHLQQ